MRSLNVGIRQLHHSTSQLLARVQDGLHLVVTKHGRPIAVVVPLARSRAWVLQNRPLVDPRTEPDATSDFPWLVQGSIQIADAAMERFDDLPEQRKARLLRRLTRLRAIDVEGRVVVREGQLWMLVELEGERGTVTVLAWDRRNELDRWLWSGETEGLASVLDQPM